MGTDIYAPDSCFDGDTVRKPEAGDDNIIEKDLKTFWIPLEAKDKIETEFLVELKHKIPAKVAYKVDETSVPQHMFKIMEEENLVAQQEMIFNQRKTGKTYVNMARKPEGVTEYPEKLHF